jgi:hypothetical protein
MGKTRTRILSILLVLVLALGFMPVSATASGGYITVWLSVIDPHVESCMFGGPPNNPDGIFFAGDYLTVPVGTTAYDLLHIVGLDVRSTGHPAWGGMYVQAINDWGEFDGGPLSGWMYRVNHTFPGFSASLFELDDEDEVRWLYTRELGEDIGGGMGNLGNDPYGGTPNFNLARYFVEINDERLTRNITMGGAFASQGANFILETEELPEGVTAVIGGNYGTHIVITGVRPAADQPGIQGDFQIIVSVGGVHPLNVTVRVNLSPDLQPSAPILFGDVNGDGVINQADITLITRHLLGHDVDALINLEAADVNSDGVINQADITLITRFILGHEVTLGPQG